MAKVRPTAGCVILAVKFSNVVSMRVISPSDAASRLAESKTSDSGGTPTTQNFRRADPGVPLISSVDTA